MEGVGGASQAAGGVAIAIGGPDNSGSAPVVSARAFWKRAELISPGRPWVAVARELGVNPAIAQDAFGNNRLPPNVNAAATARFLAQPG